MVLELCCFEWFQNTLSKIKVSSRVLELCCFEWFQNGNDGMKVPLVVLELCCFEWFQNLGLLGLTGQVSFRAVLFRMVPKL